MKKVLCVGQVAYDVTLAIDHYPEENKKMRAIKRVECAGGSAYNSAYLLASWGVDTTFIGSIGKDEEGRKIKQESEEIGLKLKLSEHDSKTTTSYILANLSNGTRTIITDKNKDLKYIGELPSEEYDMIVLDGNELELSLKVLEKYKNAITILDAGKLSDNILTLGKYVDYFVCSNDFAKDYTNLPLENIDEIYEKIASDFKGKVVITLESKGSFTKINNYGLIPSIKVKAVDSTGAGDIYHGAFAYFVLQEKPLDEVMQYANIAGALSVTKLGSRMSQPKLEEVIKNGQVELL